MPHPNAKTIVRTASIDQLRRVVADQIVQMSWTTLASYPADRWVVVTVVCGTPNEQRIVVEIEAVTDDATTITTLCTSQTAWFDQLPTIAEVHHRLGELVGNHLDLTVVPTEPASTLSEDTTDGDGSLD